MIVSENSTLFFKTQVIYGSYEGDGIGPKVVMHTFTVPLFTHVYKLVKLGVTLQWSTCTEYCISVHDTN